MSNESSESPEFHPDGSDASSSEEEEIQVTPESTIDPQTVSQHRKAFVAWINEEFYPQVIQSSKESSLKVYQVLIQKYLSLETPYRGLLVYHGLGTGKTASAVSLAEGLSSTLKINTLLPASLKTEFVKEVRRWGLRELNEDNRWSYKSYRDYSKEELVQLKEEYSLDLGSLNKIMRLIKSSYKKKLIQESDAIDSELETLLRSSEKQIKSLKGFWIPDPSGQTMDELGPIERECVLQQINFLISKKYNFIHYKPFPKVKGSKFLGLEDEDEDEDEEEEEEGSKEIGTQNQMIVKQLEKQLRYNQKNHFIDSPFHKEVIIIDEVHNFVRQILNKSKPSLVFYNWIMNATDVKLVFLSGTPVINKPCEIAILYNMLKGIIRVYSFSVQSTMSPEEMTDQLNRSIYDKPSPIELFYVEPKQGKLVISFIQESSGFESLAQDKDSQKIIYTLQTNDTSFEHFLETIYQVLSSVVQDPNLIIPSQSTLKQGNLRKIQKGEVQIFDKDLELPFNRHQKLFDIYDQGQLIDMTDNDQFMSYFFESSYQIPHKKKVLLKRMLMGMTSYYPIDRTSIVDMPQIVKPTIQSESYKGYTILKELNLVSCMMSQMQFEKYHEMWKQEKSMDTLRTMRGQYNDDAPFHYHTRTRQTCNIIYQKDDFRILKKTDGNQQEIEDLKQQTYQDIREKGSLRMDKQLSNLSPKMYEILKHMNKFTPDGVSTGKILFYSDFRSDAGSESFELVLQSHGYERFDTQKPQDSKGLRYTFITGSEDTDTRRINKEFYNKEENKYGEYIQVMIISSAGAEGLSLSCVRQAHLLEPYWNYVRIDQVLGRAIRMRSHLSLDPKDRNVEQYLYLSVLPKGTHLDMVYESIKDSDTWDIPEWSDLKSELSKGMNKHYKELFDNLVNVNLSENELSTDQYLFDVMESKYKVSTEISSVIKESSIDCIPHTRDDPELNDRCIRFSTQLLSEISYFPGITAHVLDTIDRTQLVSKTLYFIKPNIYVVSAKDTQHSFFVYYEYTLKSKESRDQIDIRYLRENAKKLAELHPDIRMLLSYPEVTESHLGKEFSVYQHIYGITDEIIRDYLMNETFPPLSKITLDREWVGSKLKYNVNNTFFFTTKECIQDPHTIFKMYPYVEYEHKQYDVSELRPIIVYNKQFYIEDVH